MGGPRFTVTLEIASRACVASLSQAATLATTSAECTRTVERLSCVSCEFECESSLNNGLMAVKLSSGATMGLDARDRGAALPAAGFLLLRFVPRRCPRLEGSSAAADDDERFCRALRD